MEMVLALLATVLFTSLSLTYNQAIWAQTDYLNNATVVVQASQLCHSAMDEIDAKIFSRDLLVRDLLSRNGKSTTKYYDHLMTTFKINTRVVNCDVTGNENPLDEFGGAIDLSNSVFKKVTISVENTYLKRPYTMTRIFTDTIVQ